MSNTKTTLLPAARLAEIRERATAATRGPWSVSRVPHEERPGTNEVADLVNDAWIITSADLAPWHVDAAFIAHARVDVPALLAHLDALTAPRDREAGGRLVRDVWIAWAKEQPTPKASWLVPWEGLSEPDKEVDRRIFEACVARGFAAGRSDGEARIATLTAQVAWWTADHARVASGLADREAEIDRLTAELAEARARCEG